MGIKYVREIIHLIFGCLNILISGFFFCFAIYSEDLKVNFGLTQTQISLLSGSLTISNYLAYFAGLIYEQFGSFKTYLLWAVLSTGPATLICVSSFYVKFHHDNFWLLVVYFFILGFALGGMYITSLQINVSIFSHKRSGLIVGISGACWYLMLMLLSTICENVDGCQIYKLFSGIAIASFLSNLTFALMEKYDKFEINDESQQLISNEIDNNSSSIHNSIENDETISIKLGCNTFVSSTYQFILWAHLLSASVNIAIILNTTVLMISLDKTYSTFSLTTVGALISVVLKFVLPTISDFHAHTVPRIIWCLLMITLQALLILVSIWYGDNSAVFITFIVINFAANTANFSITPAVLNDIFKTQHLGRNFGFVIMLGGFISFLVNIIFGELFDANIMQLNETQCQGLHCFTTFFIISSIMSMVSALLFLKLYFVESKLIKERQT